MILYGAPVREEIKNKLIKRIKIFGSTPTLFVVQVGDRIDSNLYIRNKIKFGTEIGVNVVLKKFPEDIGEGELTEEIIKINEDINADGFIVQLPLPKKIDTHKIIEFIDEKKDADGLKKIKKQENLFLTPATARAVLAILDFYKIEISNKKVAVIGQSLLAGGPIANELEQKAAQVFRCDINTKNIPEIAKSCDILVSAVGQIGLITKDFVNESQVVIDVGINKASPGKQEGESEGKKSKIVGDVDFDQVLPMVAAITPVPGGVGPVTIACLFENLVDICYNRGNY